MTRIGRQLSIGKTDNTSDQRTPRKRLRLIPTDVRKFCTSHPRQSRSASKWMGSYPHSPKPSARRRISDRSKRNGPQWKWHPTTRCIDRNLERKPPRSLPSCGRSFWSKAWRKFLWDRSCSYWWIWKLSLLDNKPRCLPCKTRYWKMATKTHPFVN